MKASDSAVAAASAFLGQDVLSNAEKLKARRALDARGVPQNDDGLRTLAANGDWATVVALADKLEDDAAARSHPHRIRKDKKDDEGHTLRVSAQAAALEARLPYVLVQVTAYFKMQRVGAAKKLMDTLGDLESEGYLYPGTDESFAPFSLRFLAALIPFYLGVPMEAQRTLYCQLDECVRKRQRAMVVDDEVSGCAQLWLHREARVRRALIYLHYTHDQYAMSIQHFNKLIEATDEVEQAAVSGGVCVNGSAAVRTTAATWHGATPQQRVRRVMLLQQFACLCLHCGAVAISEQAFQQITEVGAGASGGKEGIVLAHVEQVNEAFLLAFYGRFAEAAAKFRKIARSADDALSPDSTANPAAAIAAAEEEKGEKEKADSELFEAVLTQLRANAQTSEATCLPYCQADTVADPATAIASLIGNAEEQLRRNPRVLASSDPFVADLVRLYTLAGNRKAKLDQLAAVLEVFRCDAASLPSLEKMV